MTYHLFKNRYAAFHDHMRKPLFFFDLLWCQPYRFKGNVELMMRPAQNLLALENIQLLKSKMSLDLGQQFTGFCDGLICLSFADGVGNSIIALIS